MKWKTAAYSHDLLLSVFTVFVLSYLSGLFELTHTEFYCISVLALAECHTLLSGNLKLNLIGSPVTVFKWSFRQVNGISAERSALDV